MERENIQATLLCDNSQYITQSAVQRCMLHIWEWWDHAMQWKESNQIYKWICKQIYKAYTVCMDLQGNLHGNRRMIDPQHRSYSNMVTNLSDEEPQHRRLQTEWSNARWVTQDRDHPGMFTTPSQSTEIVNSRKASIDLNTGSRPTTESTARSTHESTGCVRSTTKSTRSTWLAGSTTWSATRSTLTLTVKVRKQPPVANLSGLYLSC